MTDITTSARVSEDLSQRLNSLASALKRSRSWIEAVEEGIRAMEAGDVVEHSVVVDDIRRKRSPKSQ